MFGPRREDPVQEFAAALKAVLVDERKIVKALVDRAASEYKAHAAKVAAKPPEDISYHDVHRLQGVIAWVHGARAFDVWGLFLHTYSPTDSGVRELRSIAEADQPFMLRQAKRLLNLAARLIDDTLQLTREAREYHRLEMAMAVHDLAASLVSLCAPDDGPVHYRHPDAERWHNILARAKRRVSEIWLEQARRQERSAAARKPTELPAVIEDGYTWDQLRIRGFDVVEPAAPGADLAKVLVPPGWSAVRNAGKVTVVDRYNRVRAEVVAVEGQPPVLRLRPRFELRKEPVENGDTKLTVWDNAGNQESAWGTISADGRRNDEKYLRERMEGFVNYGTPKGMGPLLCNWQT